MDEDEFYLFKNQSSVGPWDGPQYHIAPMWAFYLQTIFMGVVFVVGTPLNAIVLIVTVKYKKLRQPLNYILVNISFSGFLCCIFSVFTVFVSSSQGYFIFGKHMCALEGFAGATGGLVTGWSLAFLAFERYIVICKPFGNFRFSSRHALLVVAATWVIGISVAIPPFLGCSPGRPEASPSPSPAQVAAQQQESATTQKAEREVSRMVVVMVGSFCLCYVPYAALAMYMVNNRDHGLDLRLVTVPAFFSKSACVYNPIIYCFMNKQFRACIMETVCGRPMSDDSELSSSAQRTEVSSVSSSQVSPS
ncbi:short-wave-sensitive opsin 1 [Malurus melanocephalus]|uniref:short-wave-sensitive opsin 1 n=1 Tax=Malurus melanocephalus TaxID=175006 RepID=UPI002546CFF8|nr:short-wave-sensitive opsin 1 [Malurus melanocephalus]